MDQGPHFSRGWYRQKKEVNMTTKVKEIALSFFLAVCGISIFMGILWLKPVIESQRLLIEETRKNQEAIMKSAEETKAIVTELGVAVAVIAMMEKRMIQPVDANKMIEESVATIETHSSRLGKLAKLVNEFRINTQGRR
jgi:hypothetical protein